MLSRGWILKVSTAIALTCLAQPAHADNRIKHVNRATKSVGRENENARLVDRLKGIQGWALDGVDENVDFQIVIENPDPKHEVAVVRCKPFALDPKYFVKVETYTTDKGISRNLGHMDNDQVYFFAMRKGDDGKWHTLDGSKGHSNGYLTNKGDGCNMDWTTDKGKLKVTFYAH
jgi:hypothetical protein